MENILLIGGGGHCKSVIDVIELEQKFQIAGIIDTKMNVGKSVLGYEIIGSDENLPDLYKQYKYAFICIGHIKSNALRVSLYEKVKALGFVLPRIISPLAYVSKHASLDEGTIIMHGAIVNADSTIGKNCIINSKVLLEHDCIVGDHSHLAPASVINGGVKIDNHCFIGSNAVVTESVTLQEKSFIKAGSVVK